MRIKIFALLAVAAAPLAAQGTPPASGAVADGRALWSDVRGYILQSAIDMPEAKYSYRPTPEVRTFGELIAHIAGSQSMFCAIALGNAPPTENAVESKKLSKADLIDALKRSNTDCSAAYAQADAAASQMVTLFGQQRQSPLHPHGERDTRQRALWQHRDLLPDERDGTAVEPAGGGLNRLACMCYGRGSVVRLEYRTRVPSACPSSEPIRRVEAPAPTNVARRPRPSRRHR